MPAKSDILHYTKKKKKNKNITVTSCEMKKKKMPEHGAKVLYSKSLYFVVLVLSVLI